jgi:hypothetical protein
MTVFWNMTPCILVGRRGYHTTRRLISEYRDFDTERRESSDLTVATFTLKSSTECQYIVSSVFGQVISKQWTALELYQNGGRPRTVFDLQNRSLFKTQWLLSVPPAVSLKVSLNLATRRFGVFRAILGQTAILPQRQRLLFPKTTLTN